MDESSNAQEAELPRGAACLRAIFGRNQITQQETDRIETWDDDRDGVTISIPIKMQFKTPTECDAEMVGTETIKGRLLTVRDTKTGRLLAAEFKAEDGRVFAMRKEQSKTQEN